MLHIVTRLFYRFSCITIAVLLLFLSLHRTIYHRKVLIWCRAETRPFLLLLPSKEYIIMSIQSLTDQFAQALELVDSVATRAYSQNLSRMVNAVNETMQQHPQLPDLIGPNPIQVMEEHRNNLARLMLAQFRFNGARTLVGGADLDGSYSYRERIFPGLFSGGTGCLDADHRSASGCT